MKDEVLEEYFLEEIEKTDDINGWKVVGVVNELSGVSSTSVHSEFKTKDEGWLCEFKIKLLWCGLVLVSPECIVDESELIMEALGKYYKAVNPLVSELEKLISTSPYQQPYQPINSPGTWTPTWYYNGTITSSASTTIDKANCTSATWTETCASSVADSCCAGVVANTAYSTAATFTSS